MIKKSYRILLAAALAFTPMMISPGNQAGAAGQESATLFLPLKVNAVTGKDKLTEEAERLLDTAGKNSSIMVLARTPDLTRLQETAWPPAPAALAPFLPNDFAGNLAILTLTRLGNMISLDLTIHDLGDPAANSYLFKEIQSDDELPAAIGEMVSHASTFSKRRQYIAAINVTGNRRIDTGAIRSKISSRPGDRFNVTQLRKDLKEVFAMGYFTDIEISSKETGKGQEVAFAVKEKDIVAKIKITGNDKLREDTIREVIKIRGNSIINDSEIRETIGNIRNLYREEGFFNCQVKAEQASSGKDRVDLTFVVEEGEKVFIKEIVITGNRTFTTREIKKAITTSEKGWFSFITDSGLLNKEKLAHDADRITAFYHNNGFVEAKVGEPEVVRKDRWLYVYFNIEEGERYRCGKVELSGDLIEAEEVLGKLIKVDEEDFFNRMVLRQDVLRITDFYAEKGYAFAEVFPRTAKNPAEKTVDLDFKINQGSLVHINRITIAGNTRTRDKVIRREIMLKEGGLFNAVKLKESNQRLARIDYFEDVNISPETGIDDTKLDLTVKIKEKPTGKFSIGAGYSTVDKMTFMGEVSEGNLLGRGQKLAARANLSSNSTQFNIDFTEPRIFDSKLLFAFSLYNWQREYDDYTKDSRGGTLRFGYPVWEKVSLNTSYGYDDTSLSDVVATAGTEITDSKDYHITSSLQLGLLRDTRNRMYGASDGSRNVLTVKYAGGPLGGDNSFTKVEASSGWYFPVSANTTFHPNFTAGYIAGNSRGHLPVYEKFYLGGLSSIRSFDNGQISPLDPNPVDPNNPARIGGDKMWYANIEYIFPLAKGQGLQGVIFYDIGNVYGIDQSWQFGDYKHAAGAGFRWMSPIGPLRLEWAQNLNPVGDEDDNNWEFSIGGMF